MSNTDEILSIIIDYVINDECRSEAEELAENGGELYDELKAAFNSAPSSQYDCFYRLYSKAIELGFNIESKYHHCDDGPHEAICHHAEYGNIEAMKALIDLGASIFPQDTSLISRIITGHNPDYIMRAYDHHEFIKYLADRGAPMKLEDWARDGVWREAARLQREGAPQEKIEWYWQFL